MNRSKWSKWSKNRLSWRIWDDTPRDHFWFWMVSPLASRLEDVDFRGIESSTTETSTVYLTKPSHIDIFGLMALICGPFGGRNMGKYRNYIGRYRNYIWSRSKCWGLVSDQPHLSKCVFHCFSMPWPDLELQEMLGPNSPMLISSTLWWKIKHD